MQNVLDLVQKLGHGSHALPGLLSSYKYGSVLHSAWSHQLLANQTKHAGPGSTFLPGLSFLAPHNNERASILIKYQRHCCCVLIPCTVLSSAELPTNELFKCRGQISLNGAASSSRRASCKQDVQDVYDRVLAQI